MNILRSPGVVHWYYRLCVQEKLNAQRLIVITGCDSGLGYSLALHCQALGATVLAGVLDPDGQAARNLTDSKVIVHHLDCTNEGSIEQFGKHVNTLCIEKKHGEYQGQAIARRFIRVHVSSGACTRS